MAITHVICLLNGERAHVPVTYHHTTSTVTPIRKEGQRRPEPVMIESIIFVTSADRKSAGFEGISKARVEPQAFGANWPRLQKQRKSYAHLVTQAWSFARDRANGRPRLIKPSQEKPERTSRGSSQLMPRSWMPQRMAGKVMPS